jgi:hypothetical protein
MAELFWQSPAMNHATQLFNTGVAPRTSFNINATSNMRRGAEATPRFKNTWLVEFRLNRNWKSFSTNVMQFINNGRIYAHVQKIDHPKVSFELGKLRSYNRTRLFPMKMEMPPASMTFFNDATSMISALTKDMISFYSYMGEIGTLGSDNGLKISGTDQILGPKFDGNDARTEMAKRPSLGIRLRPNSQRHFFDQIVIYDLGTEPDSMDVHVFQRPFVTSIDGDAYDYQDTNGLLTYTMQFESEGYYSLIGVNNRVAAGQMQATFGFAAIAPGSDGHAVMGRGTPANPSLQTPLRQPGEQYGPPMPPEGSFGPPGASPSNPLGNLASAVTNQVLGTATNIAGQAIANAVGPQAIAAFNLAQTVGRMTTLGGGDGVASTAESTIRNITSPIFR